MNNLTQPPNQGFHKVIKNKESGKQPTLKAVLEKCDLSKFKIHEEAQEKPQVIYEALYCPDIHESAYMTLSIHKTKEGATRVIIDSILEELEKYKPLMAHNSKLFNLKNFGEYENWHIRETEILD